MSYSKGKITIPSVGGNIVISVTTKATEKQNLFDKNDNDVVIRARFNSSHMPTDYADGQLVTGFIPADSHSVFTVETDKANNTNNYTGVAQLYNANKDYIGSYSAPKAAPSAQKWVWSTDYLKGVLDCSITPNGGTNSGVAHVRFCIAYTDIDNIVITK